MPSIDRHEIKVTAGFDNTQLASGLRTSGHMVKEWASEIATTLAGLFAAEKIFEFTKGIIEFGKQISLTAERLNVTTDEAQRLSYAAKLTGVELDGVANAFDRLAKAKMKALSGGSSGQSFVAAFAGFGISLKEISDLSPAELFQRISDRVAETGSNAETTADAMELFGKSGGKLIPLLKEFKELHDKAPIVSSEDIENIRQAGDQMEKFYMNAKAFSATTFTRFFSKNTLETIYRSFGEMKFRLPRHIRAEVDAESAAAFKEEQAHSPKPDVDNESAIIDKALVTAKNLLKVQEFLAKNAKDKLKAEQESLKIQEQITRLEEQKAANRAAPYMPTLQQLANAPGWAGNTARRINMLSRDAVNANLKGNYGRAADDVNQIEGVDVPVANLSPWQQAQNNAQAKLNARMGFNHALPFDQGGYHIDGLKDSLRNAGLQPKEDKLTSIDARIKELNEKLVTKNGLLQTEIPSQ